MILCRKSYTTPPHTLLELIIEFGKIAVYQINVQKSLIFPYTKNEQNKITPFITASKIIKYLGVNLTKEAWVLQTTKMIEINWRRAE